MKIINIRNSCPCRRWKDDLDEACYMPAGAVQETGGVERREDGHHVFGAAAWDYHSSGSHFLPVAQI